MICAGEGFGAPLLLEEGLGGRAWGVDALEVVEIPFGPILAGFLDRMSVFQSYGDAGWYPMRTGAFKAWNFLGIVCVLADAHLVACASPYAHHQKFAARPPGDGVRDSCLRHQDIIAWSYLVYIAMLQL